MSTIFILLRPRLLSFFNNYRLGQKNKSWIRLFMFGSVGAVFWVGSFILFYRVLLYFQSVQDFGDILAMKLLSMIIITLFALLMFSSIINSLSHFYLSRDLPLLHFYLALLILPGWL
jgi:ABC-2 type transport system permease protein